MKIRIAGVLVAAVTSLGISPALRGAEAPVDKGAVLIGGSLSLLSYGDNLSDWYEVSLLPEVQVFVIPNLAVGAEFILDYRKFGRTTNLQLDIGPVVSYYFGRGTQKGYPFVKAGALYEYSRYRQAGALSTSTADEVRLLGSAGYVHFLAKNIALSFSLDYTYEQNMVLDIGFSRQWREAWGVSAGLKAFLF